MSKEAMTLALEMVRNKMYAHAEMYLTEALAKQEQGEPVAWMDPDDIGADTAFKWFQTKQFKQPVYTKPQPSQKPLTDAHLYLESLVDALDGAFISTWQSTCAWQTQLDEARNYLIFHGIKE